MFCNLHTGSLPPGYPNPTDDPKNGLVVVLVAKLYLTFATPWAVTRQAPLSMGFPRQEHWSGLPFPSQGDLPDPRIEPLSPALQSDSLLLSHQGSPKQE